MERIFRVKTDDKRPTPGGDVVELWLKNCYGGDVEVEDITEEYQKNYIHVDKISPMLKGFAMKLAHTPQKPTEYCECEEPLISGSSLVVCERCMKLIKPKPTPKIPKKIKNVNELLYSRSVANKINEIIKYLEDKQ